MISCTYDITAGAAGSTSQQNTHRGADHRLGVVRARKLPIVPRMPGRSLEHNCQRIEWHTNRAVVTKGINRLLSAGATETCAIQRTVIASVQAKSSGFSEMGRMLACFFGTIWIARLGGVFGV